MNQDKIRLLLTEDSLPVGGAETLMLQYLEHLDRHIFDVHLLTLRGRGALLSDAQKRADHYACVCRRFGLDIAALIRLRKYIVRHSITVVHVNQWLDALYVLLASKGLKLVRVATFHGFIRTWRQHVHLRVLKHFDRVFCVSQSVKLDLYKMGLPWDKLVVVYNCYDDKRFGKTSSLQNNEDDRPFRMVMVGNFWWSKDQRTLIKAVNILKNRGYKIELYLVGNRTSIYFEACRSLVNEMDLNGVVKFWENKRVDQELLSRFDLFVFSSFADTCSIALLEAMACGLPVLVSDIPSAMELIGHGECGLYFETGNPSNCAKAIARIIEDKEVRKLLGHKAYLRSQDFRPDKRTRDLERAYMDILGASS